MNKNLTNFFQFIFRDSFKINISMENKRKYKKKKKRYENYIILAKYPRYKNNSNFNIHKFEKEIIENFYKKNDPTASIILLRNHIQEIYGLSQKLSEIKKKRGYLQRKETVRYLEDFRVSTIFIRVNIYKIFILLILSL